MKVLRIGLFEGLCCYGPGVPHVLTFLRCCGTCMLCHALSCCPVLKPIFLHSLHLPRTALTPSCAVLYCPALLAAGGAVEGQPGASRCGHPSRGPHRWGACPQFCWERSHRAPWHGVLAGKEEVTVLLLLPCGQLPSEGPIDGATCLRGGTFGIMRQKAYMFKTSGSQCWCHSITD